MKTTKGFGNLRSHLAITLCAVGGLLVLCAPPAGEAINTVASNAAAVQPDAAPQAVAAPAHNSAGVDEVLKMVDAKVDPSVIAAYVRGSGVAYSLSANEIIDSRIMGCRETS